MHPYLNLFKRIGTDRLNLHNFLISILDEGKVMPLVAFGMCGPSISASRCLISASALSCNAAHLNEHSSPVKRRKTEEARKLHWKDIVADTKRFARACCSE
jgi:hypothetical protein